MLRFHKYHFCTTTFISIYIQIYVQIINTRRKEGVILARKKLPIEDKQSITIHFRLKPRIATLVRLASKIEGDKNLSAFIYRQVVPIAEQIVTDHKNKVVASESVR